MITQEKTLKQTESGLSSEITASRGSSFRAKLLGLAAATASIITGCASNSQPKHTISPDADAGTLVYPELGDPMTAQQAADIKRGQEAQARAERLDEQNKRAAYNKTNDALEKGYRKLPAPLNGGAKGLEGVNAFGEALRQLGRR